MLINTSLDKIDNLVYKLSKEKDKWMSLAIAIDLADEILKVLLPDNKVWLDQLERNSKETGKLPQPLSLNTFKNQKQVKWFNPHPESASARSAFKLFYDSNCVLESNFFWFSETATKQKIAAATEYSQNWEDSELTRKPQYKVGIDFFLTSDSNRLIVVLSNNQKLRALELHDHLSNTQKLILKNKLDGAVSYTSIENESVLESEPQRRIHSILWNSFEIKEVNKQFYKYIAEHFTELVEQLRKDSKSIDDAKQFSSRLLGRLLFVWFLRKMEIIDERMNYFVTNNLSSSDYYETKLKQLFFNTLNTEIENRENGDIVTPYLNGGLFEPKDNDYKFEYINFPEDYFTRLYNHFDEFNFTTDESSSDFELIAVDPEMLGQVFESLLAAQSDEDSNERNDTGSFYTPREVVGYMVKETLRQYLYSKLDKSTHKGIDELLDLSDSQWLNRKSTSKVDIWGVNSKKVISDIKKSLDDFKVLDPAVGSGAFPMGMLQQLLKIYERIETRFDPYKLKLSIIENNIFGVDIQPMAVEISRLRAWLSVIVDETDKNNIHPLPNLEFKFISANSLQKLSVQESNIFSDSNLETNIKLLQNKYFNARSSKKKKEYQEKYYNLTIRDGDIFEDERSTQLRSFDPFKNRYTAEYFDPKIMFGVSDGFDAIIGNPPYVSVKRITSKEKEIYKKTYNSAKNRFNLFTLFHERGIDLLKEGGILSYIQPIGIFTQSDYKYIREIIINNTKINSIVRFNHMIFDSASVNTAIILYIKDKANENNISIFENINKKIMDFDQFNANKKNDYIIPVAMSENSYEVIKKIESSSTHTIEEFLEIQQGIIYSGTPKNEIFSNTVKNEKYKKCLDGRDIQRWNIKWNEKLENKYIEYSSKLHRPREERLFLSKEKILMPRRSTLISATIDDEQYYALNTAYICLLKNNSLSHKCSLKYLLGLLNSELINYYYQSMYTGFQITIPALNSLPIVINTDYQSKVENIVTKMLNSPENSNHFEKELNNTIFEIYKLTTDEIKVIQNYYD
ncbi:type II restriction endonuclease [Mammaliicoccus sciuri]|nr:type II restriction endonuclease [Mammaliicoccus sciuri]